MTLVFTTQDGERPQGFDDQMNSADDGGMNTMSTESEPSSAQMQQMQEQMQEQMQDAAGGLLVFLVIYLVLLVIALAGMWKTFSKANIPGILAIIPIVNLFFLPQVGGNPAWWGILYFVPLVNIVIVIMVKLAIAERFNRGVGTALGLIFLPPIFYCILGFGSAQWTPPPAEN